MIDEKLLNKTMEEHGIHHASKEAATILFMLMQYDRKLALNNKDKVRSEQWLKKKKYP